MNGLVPVFVSSQYIFVNLICNYGFDSQNIVSVLEPQNNPEGAVRLQFVKFKSVICSLIAMVIGKRQQLLP